MLKSRETPLNAERNPLQCNDVCEHGIPHDVASHQSPPFILKQTSKYITLIILSLFDKHKLNAFNALIFLLILTDLTYVIIYVNNINFIIKSSAIFKFTTSIKMWICNKLIARSLARTAPTLKFVSTIPDTFLRLVHTFPLFSWPDFTGFSLSTTAIVLSCSSINWRKTDCLLFSFLSWTLTRTFVIDRVIL